MKGWKAAGHMVAATTESQTVMWCHHLSFHSELIPEAQSSVKNRRCRSGSPSPTGNPSEPALRLHACCLSGLVVSVKLNNPTIHCNLLTQLSHYLPSSIWFTLYGITHSLHTQWGIITDQILHHFNKLCSRLPDAPCRSVRSYERSSKSWQKSSRRCWDLMMFVDVRSSLGGASSILSPALICFPSLLRQTMSTHTIKVSHAHVGFKSSNDREPDHSWRCRPVRRLFASASARTQPLPELAASQRRLLIKGQATVCILPRIILISLPGSN